jgi:cell division transport system permease protein
VNDLSPSYQVPDEAPEQVRRSLPANLNRNAPLVPGDPTGGRALGAVVAILTFLAALCAGGAELIAASSAQWRSNVSREVTIQVRPNPQRDVEADVARAADLARRSPGIEAVQPFTKAESERLLEPWLGTGLNFTDLPVPRIIVIRLVEGARPDFTDLRRSLREGVPGASLDDHALWASRLTAMANTIVGGAVTLVLLVLAAAGLAVVFATRGAMAGNHDVIEVLHFVGAKDDFIAREFQRRFFIIGLKGAVVGAGAALFVFLALGLITRSWRASPAGDQIEALFGAFQIGWRGYAVMVLIAFVVSALAGIVSRITVRRFLGATS